MRSELVMSLVLLWFFTSSALADQAVTPKDVAAFLSTRGINRGTVFTPDNGTHHFIIRDVKSGSSRSGVFNLNVQIELLPPKR